MNTDFLGLVMFNLFCYVYSLILCYFCGISDLLSGKTQAKGIFLNLYSSASYILMLTVLICHPENKRGKQLLQTHKIMQTR